MISMIKLGEQKRMARKRLSPTRITDQEIDKQVRGWPRLQVFRLPESSEHAFAVVGTKYCLLHGASHWRYYQLPKEVHHCVMEHNNARLWFVVADNQLATLDLRSGEWSEYKHAMPYCRILYAGEDEVIALCSDILAIDIVRLRDGHAMRIANVPIDVQDFSVRNNILDGIFLPEQERFFLLEESLEATYEYNFTLLSYNWRLQEEKVLSAKGVRAALCFPFVVILNNGRRELTYVDLRKEPVEYKHVTLSVKPEWGQLEWMLDDAFAFGDDLIVSLRAISSQLGALVRVSDQPEMLYSNLSLWPTLNRLGPFLVSKEQFVYDLANRTAVSNMSRSALLREVIRYEAEQSKPYRPNPKPLSASMRALESSASDTDTFEVFLKTVPVSIAEAEDKSLYLSGSISSTKGDVAFSIGESIYLLPSNKSNFLSPLPQPNDGWKNLAIDEQGRFWLCDSDGQYISIISLSEGEARGSGIVLNKPPQAESGMSGLKLISASRNHLVMVGWDDWLEIYHYDGRTLKKTFEWDNARNIEVVFVEPNTQDGGWWVGTWHRDKEIHILKHLDNTGHFWEVMQMPYQIRVIGDLVEQVYFAYTDNAYQLHYTQNPYNGWQQVALQNVLGEEYVQRMQGKRLVVPVALHNVNNQLYLLLGERSLENTLPDASFFMSLKSDKASLISSFRNIIRLSRWGDWLILHSRHIKEPLRLAPEHEEHAQIIVIPENRNLLFYHPSTNQFSEYPYATYSVTSALRSILTRKSPAVRHEQPCQLKSHTKPATKQ